MARWDVFLSHNSDDRDAVVAIAERLRTEGIAPWVDAWDLVSGAAWQEGLVDGIRAASTTAVSSARQGSVRGRAPRPC